MSRNSNEASRYSVVFEWSPASQAYVVILPEWSDRYVLPVGDRSTYEEACASAHDALETFTEHVHEDGIPLPEPRE